MPLTAGGPTDPTAEDAPPGHEAGSRALFYIANMRTIASKELQNHTSRVLDEVSQGEVYTVTVHGRPVAELRGVGGHRRPGVPRSDLLALLDRQRPDPALAADMDWIADGSTADFGDPSA